MTSTDETKLQEQLTEIKEQLTELNSVVSNLLKLVKRQPTGTLRDRLKHGLSDGMLKHCNIEWIDDESEALMYDTIVDIVWKVL